MSGADYFHCPMCNTKALYDASEAEDMPDVEVLHRECFKKLRDELARYAERLDQMRPVVEAAQAWHTALAAANDVGVQIQDLAAFRASEELCAAVDALAEPSELAAEDTTAAEPSGTEAGRACRADCDEIPGYCTSGWGCLGSGTEADRLPRAPCHMKPLHIAHPWGDPAHWCDGAGTGAG